MCCFNRQFSLSSQPLHRLPLPPRGETHLWYVIPNEIKSTSLLKQYQDILSPFEKKSVLSFQEDEVRKKALLARVLVRTTISRYQTNSFVDPRSLKFKKNSYGKPEVDWQDVPDMNWPPLHFNLSHSSSLIACGITTYSPIGIDVEDKNRTTKNDVISFASRFFSPCEVDHLANISELELQRQEFIKLWTLKESDIAVESSQFKTGEWQLALLDLDDTHYVAICTQNDKFSKENTSPMALRVWKTIPFSEDMCISGTRSVITVGGLVKQL
uniref:holo-[acyl-carrier-protein] synthase n=1 Tax=Chenopodium quinoa TaxID=63459 RepID=A0A803LRD0_CHEQI